MYRTGQPVQIPVAIPSKPGQRLQYKNPQKLREGGDVSQSLPNQVNDFNEVGASARYDKGEISQSLPSQVNDFNGVTESRIIYADGVSQFLPNQVNDFNFLYGK